MRRYVPILAAASLALAAPLVGASSASAFGGETLGCSVNPGGYGSGQSSCGTSVPASSYSVGYNVQGGSGSYTYSWTVHGGTITAGCTSTTDYCAINAIEIANDRYLTASVVITQGSSQATLSATAYIPAGCGNYLC
jgi:hypothetical protein